MSEKNTLRCIKSIASLVLGAVMVVTPLIGLASLQTSAPEDQGVSSEKLQRYQTFQSGTWKRGVSLE